MCRYTCSHCVLQECVYRCMSKYVHVPVEAQGWSVSSAIALHLLHWNRPLAEPRNWHLLVWGVACSGIPVSLHSFALKLQMHHHSHPASFVDSGNLNSIQSSHLHNKTLQVELSPSLRMLFHDVITRLYKMSYPPAWECSSMTSWQVLHAELSPSLKMLFYEVKRHTVTT